jgi:hypothetical protein
VWARGGRITLSYGTDWTPDPTVKLSVTGFRILRQRAGHPVAVGKLKLDTPLPISTRAAIQHPTKLGLKANQTINVEDAIKGLVTKSANDAAAGFEVLPKRWIVERTFASISRNRGRPCRAPAVREQGR